MPIAAIRAQVLPTLLARRKRSGPVMPRCGRVRRGKRCSASQPTPKSAQDSVSGDGCASSGVWRSPVETWDAETMVKRILLIGVVAAAIVAIIAVLNARDPYGGPIEPSGEH